GSLPSQQAEDKSASRGVQQGLPEQRVEAFPCVAGSPGAGVDRERPSKDVMDRRKDDGRAKSRFAPGKEGDRSSVIDRVHQEAAGGKGSAGPGVELEHPAP